MQEAVAAGTWAQSGAGCFLDILPLTEGAPVERCRVGAAPAPFLPATPTAGAADRPLSPRRPPTVHWPDREGLGSGSGGFLRRAGPREGAGGQRAYEPGASGLSLSRRSPEEGPSLHPGPQGLAEPSDTLLLASVRAARLSCSSQGTSSWNPGQPPSDCSWGRRASHSEALLPILGTNILCPSEPPLVSSSLAPCSPLTSDRHVPSLCPDILLPSFLVRPLSS